MATFTPTCISPLIKLYTLTLLEKIHAKYKIQRILKQGEFEAYRMCATIGIPLSRAASIALERNNRDFILEDSLDLDDAEHIANSKQFKKSVSLAYKRIVSELKSDDELFSPDKLPGSMPQNLLALLKLIPMTEIEKRILVFVYLMHYDTALGTCARAVRGVHHSHGYSILAELLRTNEESVKDALSANSPLIKSGLIELEFHRHHDLTEALKPMNERFLHNFVDNPSAHEDIFRTEWRTASLGTLSWSDYAHLEPLISGLRAYVDATTTKAGVGGNVLLYGPPGTGKTELTRLLGKLVDVPVYEVSSENDDGNPIIPLKRLNSLRAAQTVLQSQRAILVFDEVEDVFSSRDEDRNFDSSEFSHMKTSKAWLNKTLEESKVLTFWITNQTSTIDRAYLRRFDFVAKVPVPPVKSRETQIRELLGTKIKNSVMSAIAAHRNVSPAMLSRTAKVLSMIESDITDQSALCKRMIDENLAAQRYLPTGTATASSNAARYEPTWVNCPTDLCSMAKQLHTYPTGRVLLYGPPGTGKTAFGHWLARQLDKPLILRKVSDLLGMYVGESEQNIAQAFEEAQRTQSILMIDEVDSFLQSRNNANRSWEVTLVNEMLTQIECFEGLFIASTNLNEELDSAAFRRFDIKLHFDYIRKEQLLQLVQRELAHVWADNEPPTIPCEAALQMAFQDVGRCTPGDVAAVIRQHRFNPIVDEIDFAARLKSDLLLRHKERKSIGFLG
ncbi:SpoVK/Ycf46/Vps4 family AAA+-type ATPase [Limnobacter thiooxidans]|uniref:AAA+ ATPase domain-containing protein n=1 Tax=Limnobacter thiooxidans TaxID=131080 RepID=A0AA86J2K6_9BURK|nr:SpoVK/Ycf46/Vps4 family AAA+-type ATPase [Limnobacter thiooxidans]BET26521.1 hypothetical protein RGQ30_20220 [Limnobacter thiooxidans]